MAPRVATIALEEDRRVGMAGPSGRRAPATAEPETANAGRPASAPAATRPGRSRSAAGTDGAEDAGPAASVGGDRGALGTPLILQLLDHPDENEHRRADGQEAREAGSRREQHDEVPEERDAERDPADDRGRRDDGGIGRGVRVALRLDVGDAREVGQAGDPVRVRRPAALLDRDDVAHGVALGARRESQHEGAAADRRLHRSAADHHRPAARDGRQELGCRRDDDGEHGGDEEDVEEAARPAECGHGAVRGPARVAGDG